MKLTWFGGTTLRIHVSGTIFLVDPTGISGVDDVELVSGADRIFALGDVFPEVDPVRWQPRRVAARIDESGSTEVSVHRVATGAVLIDASGEPPLVLATGGAMPRARWTGNAVVVVFGNAANLPAIAASVLDAMVPRLIAVAGPEAAVEAVVSAIGSRLNGTGLVSLEPGMALEV